MSALLALCAGSGCDESAKGTPAAQPGRVVAVSQAKQQANESELCDVLKAPEGAPTFEFPPLREPAKPAGAGLASGAIQAWASFQRVK